VMLLKMVVEVVTELDTLEALPITMLPAKVADEMDKVKSAAQRSELNRFI